MRGARVVCIGRGGVLVRAGAEPTGVGEKGQQCWLKELQQPPVLAGPGECSMARRAALILGPLWGRAGFLGLGQP